MFFSAITLFSSLAIVVQCVLVTDNSCQCGIRKTEDGISARIVMGRESLSHEFPWVVGLYRSKRKKSFCAGALVTNRHVLTAAHCLTETTARYISVGDHDYKTYRDGSRYKLVKRYKIHQVIHPKYQHDEDDKTKPPLFDAAIIEIYVPLMFRYYKHARPICLPSPFDMLDEGDSVVAGWGTTSYKGSKSQTLQYANLPIKPFSSCQITFQEQNITLGFIHLCAGGEGEDTCQGDSGSILSMKRSKDESTGEIEHYEAIGITSFGSNCGVIGVPGVYTRIPLILDWVLETIGRKVSSTAKVCNGAFGNWKKNLDSWTVSVF